MPLVTYGVDGNSGDHDRTAHHLLEKCIDTQHIEAGVKRGKEQDASDRARHSPLATGQLGPADDGYRDRFQVIDAVAADPGRT